MGLWGHGNDLGDSQLEKGEVTEDALFPLGEFPKGYRALWQSQETVKHVLCQDGAGLACFLSM